MPCVTFQANRMFGSIYLNPWAGPCCLLHEPKAATFLPQVFSGDSHTIAEAFRLLPDRFWMTLQPFLSCLRWPFGWLPVR